MLVHWVKASPEKAAKSGFLQVLIYAAYANRSTNPLPLRCRAVKAGSCSAFASGSGVPEKDRGS
jgi:hypothetical protein